LKSNFSINEINSTQNDYKDANIVQLGKGWNFIHAEHVRVPGLNREKEQFILRSPVLAYWNISSPRYSPLTYIEITFENHNPYQTSRARNAFLGFRKCFKCSVINRVESLFSCIKQAEEKTVDRLRIVVRKYVHNLIKLPRNTTKISARITSSPAEIRTECLPHTEVNYYRFI
jgi:hypothetical protein